MGVWRKWESRGWLEGGFNEWGKRTERGKVGLRKKESYKAREREGGGGREEEREEGGLR